jgi:pyruvate dehydrogenase E2 component (dihydrolipoamide acetyltransferase)
MPAPAHKLGDVVPVSRIMKITGEKMVQSKQTIPCFYLTTTVDMTDLFELRSTFNKKSNVKVAFNDFIIAAIAKGIKQFPIMAGQLDGSNIKIAANINVGLAVSVGDDLMAPVVKNADTKTAAQIAADTQSLVEKARSGKISPADLSEGVCTLSNLGAFGVESFIPIAIPGQCSIFGAGKIVDTIVPSQGSFLLKKMMSLTISVDHRVANGAYAAQFLDFVKKLLENPQGLV